MAAVSDDLVAENKLRADELVRAVAGASIYLLHDLHDLDLDPAAAGMAAVVTGHSHKPQVRREGNVVYVNPGSAGPRRFRLPVSVARLRLEGGRVDAELIEIVKMGAAGSGTR